MKGIGGGLGNIRGTTHAVHECIVELWLAFGKEYVLAQRQNFPWNVFGRLHGAPIQKKALLFFRLSSKDSDHQIYGGKRCEKGQNRV